MNTQAPSDCDYFRWRASENAPPVALSRKVMAAIQRQALAQFQPRGPECGGVLLGNRNAASGEFVVDDFEAAEMEPGDNMARWRERAGSQLLGIYRSQTRPGLAVTPHDCALVEELLPRSEGVLLLVKPLSARECVGALFQCDGGVVVDEAATAREFAMGSAEPVESSNKRFRTLLPLTALAAGIGLAFLIHGQREHVQQDEVPAVLLSIPAVPEASIALKAISDGNVIHVSWDAASPSVQGAPDALLTVSDGEKTSSMRLMNTDLQRGRLDWRPATRNVTFQMKVNRVNAEPLTEFARAAAAEEPINSSSALRMGKPSPLANASAATGEQEEPVETAPISESPAVRHRAEPLRAQSVQRKPGRIKRVFGGITSKASHLWPFHSGRQD